MQRTDSFEKNPDAGKDQRWEEKGTTEDEMVGWHHWLNGHEFEQISGGGDGQGGLACCSPWGRKESDVTELNWTFSWANNTVLSPTLGSRWEPQITGSTSVRRGNDQYTYNHSVPRQPAILLFTSVQCPIKYTKCSTHSYKTGFVLPHYRLT